MKELPLISIVVPIYNSEQYLPRCLNSILSQSYHNLEILLIDDGSPDNSGAICDKYAEKDKRIKVFHKENTGTGPTRSFGIKHSSGSYIAFVDSDDIIKPNMYELLLGAMEGNDITVCMFNYLHKDGSLVYSQEDINPKILGFHKSVEFAHYLYDGGYSNGIVCAVWNKLYRRSVLEGINIDNGIIGEDEELNDLVNVNDVNVYVIKDELYFWCENNDSVTHRHFSQLNFHFLEVLEQRYRLFVEDDYLRIKTLLLYCNVYIEYYYKAQKYKVVIPRAQKNFFYKSCFLLIKSCYWSMKFYTRIFIFSVSPTLYKIIVE